MAYPAACTSRRGCAGSTTACSVRRSRSRCTPTATASSSGWQGPSALAFASYNDSTSVAVASSGFFGGMLGSGWRWLCTLRREERLRARQVAASLLVVATLLGWFTVLLLHDEDVPRYTRETCELARNGFPGGDRVSSLDDILRACVEDGQ